LDGRSAQWGDDAGFVFIMLFTYLGAVLILTELYGKKVANLVELKLEIAFYTVVLTVIVIVAWNFF